MHVGLPFVESFSFGVLQHKTDMLQISYATHDMQVMCLARQVQKLVPLL